MWKDIFKAQEKNSQKKKESTRSWGVHIWNNPQEIYAWQFLWWDRNNGKWPTKVWECFPQIKPFREFPNWVGWTYIQIVIDWCSLKSLNSELIQWSRHEITAPSLSAPHCWSYPWNRCAGKLLCHFCFPSHEFAALLANASPDFVPWNGWQRMRSGWDGMRCVPGPLWVVG